MNLKLRVSILCEHKHDLIRIDRKSKANKMYSFACFVFKDRTKIITIKACVNSFHANAVSTPYASAML